LDWEKSLETNDSHAADIAVFIERHKDEWLTLAGLTELKGVDESTLYFAVSPIVEKYGPIIQHRHSLERDYIAYRKAIKAVAKIRETVGQLGTQNRRTISRLIRLFYSQHKYRPPSINTMLWEMETQLMVVAGALALLFRPKLQVDRVPTFLYRDATQRLMLEWKKLVPSCEKFPWPRSHHGVNILSSTEFVFQCLKMADPTIDASRARTAIENVIEGDKGPAYTVKSWEDLMDDMGPEFPTLFKDAIRVARASRQSQPPRKRRKKTGGRRPKQK
jgi:hypothetical protein